MSQYCNTLYRECILVLLDYGAEVEAEDAAGAEVEAEAEAEAEVAADAEAVNSDDLERLTL